MASLFQVFVDKENAEPLGVHPKGKSVIRNSHGHAAKSKTFQSQNLSTPRRALGDVNRDLKINSNTPATQKPVSQSKCNGIPQLNFKESDIFKKPISQPRQQNVNKSQVTKKQKPSVLMTPDSVTQSEVSPQPVDEIEHMFISKDTEDDYEDILPKKYRISSYLDELLSWRPSCLVPDDESDEESDDHFNQIAKSLENMSFPEPRSLTISTEEQIELVSDEELFDHSVLEEVDLPSVIL